MSYDKLIGEIRDDPLGRGYAGMTNSQVAASLIAIDRTRNRPTMTGSEVLNAIDVNEWRGLIDAEQNRIWSLLALGTLNPFGVEAEIVKDVFGPDSRTVAALAEARRQSISRAEELGIPPSWVTEGRIETARRVIGD